MNGKIFISYSWKEPSGSIVNNWLLPSLKASGINCLVDKEACGYNANIDKFEKEIPNAAMVVLVLSSEFFHSLDCMFEASLAVAKCDMEKQVYVINLQNYNFRKDEGNLLGEVSSFFEEMKMKLEDALSKLSDSAKGVIKDDLRKINIIRGNLNVLWKMLRSKNSATFEMLSKDGFKHVCDMLKFSFEDIDCWPSG